VNRIRHEESTEARNKTVQEHYGRKMTMVLGWTTKLSDPKNRPQKPNEQLARTWRNQHLLLTYLCVTEIYHRVHTSDIAQKNCCPFLHYNYNLKKISPRMPNPWARYHSTNFYYNFGSKKTTQPFLNRKIPLSNKNQINGEKFKMTGLGGFIF
jgi:hypothetical protein